MWVGGESFGGEEGFVGAVEDALGFAFVGGLVGQHGVDQ